MAVISINRAPDQGAMTSKGRKAVERQWHFADTVRTVRLFYGDMSIAKIARRERTGYNFIEDLVREHSRPEFTPFPLAARLTRRAS